MPRLSASSSSASNCFFSRSELSCQPCISLISFSIAVCGSAYSFVLGSIAVVTKEMLLATASYSAKSLKPYFLTTTSRSVLVLGIRLVQKYCALHFFRYRRHVPLGGDEALHVLFNELNLRCRGLRRCVDRRDDDCEYQSRKSKTKYLFMAATSTLRAHHASPFAA